MTDLFGHSVRSERLALYVAEAVTCFLLVHLAVGLGAEAGAADEVRAASLAALLALATGIAAGATGMHDPVRWTRARGLALGGLLIALLLLLPAWVAMRVMPAPSGAAPSGSAALAAASLAAVGAGAVVATRLLFLGLSRSGVFVRPIAVFAAGEDPLPRGIGPDEPFRVARRLDARTPTPTDVLRATGVRIVVADDVAAVPAPLRARWARDGVAVMARAEFLERHEGRVDLATLEPGWLAGSRAARTHPAEAAFRRSFDILTALAVLLVTLPLLLLAMLAIRLDGPGPVFYRQDRVGRGGRVFRLMKLRSMRVDAEAGGAPVWAAKADPRVTRVGRLLRLARVDEIPQVLNVLRGDMAFIGPRPERPAFVAQLAASIPHYADRAVVKPGITGWAQVRFPYGASVEDARQKLAYDLYYVRRRSLFLDLLILVATVRVVLFQEGSR